MVAMVPGGVVAHAQFHAGKYDAANDYATIVFSSASSRGSVCFGCLSVGPERTRTFGHRDDDDDADEGRWRRGTSCLVRTHPSSVRRRSVAGRNRMLPNHHHAQHHRYNHRRRRRRHHRRRHRHPLLDGHVDRAATRWSRDARPVAGSGPAAGSGTPLGTPSESSVAPAR